jgi:hypothetical protein
VKREVTTILTLCHKGRGRKENLPFFQAGRRPIAALNTFPWDRHMHRVGGQCVRVVSAVAFQGFVMDGKTKSSSWSRIGAKVVANE